MCKKAKALSLQCDMPSIIRCIPIRETIKWEKNGLFGVSEIQLIRPSCSIKITQSSGIVSHSSFAPDDRMGAQFLFVACSTGPSGSGSQTLETSASPGRLVVAQMAEPHPGFLIPHVWAKAGESESLTLLSSEVDAADQGPHLENPCLRCCP